MITTAQCQRCKGTFRQMVQNGEHSTSTQVRMTMIQCCLTMFLLEESFCLHSSLMVVMALSYSLFPSVLPVPLPLSFPSIFSSSLCLDHPVSFTSLPFISSSLLHSSCFHPLAFLNPSLPLSPFASLLFLYLSLPPCFLHPLSLSPPPPQHANWMCPSCVQAVKAEEDRHKSSSSSNSLSVQQSSKEVQTPSTNPGGCNCAACVAKRWEEHYCI